MRMRTNIFSDFNELKQLHFFHFFNVKFKSFKIVKNIVMIKINFLARKFLYLKVFYFATVLVTNGSGRPKGTGGSGCRVQNTC